MLQPRPSPTTSSSFGSSHPRPRQGLRGSQGPQSPANSSPNCRSPGGHRTVCGEKWNRRFTHTHTDLAPLWVSYAWPWDLRPLSSRFPQAAAEHPTGLEGLTRQLSQAALPPGPPSHSHLPSPCILSPSHSLGTHGRSVVLTPVGRQGSFPAQGFVQTSFLGALLQRGKSSPCLSPQSLPRLPDRTLGSPGPK